MHVRAEFAGLQGSRNQLAHSGHKTFIEGYGLLRRGGGVERGAVALPGVGGQGKLADNQHVAGNIVNGQVHFPFVIRKNAHGRNFSGQPCGILRAVSAGHSHNGVAEALKRGRGVLLVSRRNSRADALSELAARHKVAVRHVSDEQLSRALSRSGGGGEHRGFALEPHTLEDVLAGAGDSSLLVLLDGITDPRNLGAVLRSADQFGADGVIVPRRRSAGRDADSLSRSSSGAVEWVPVVETSNMVRSMEILKKNGYWLWGADMAGEPLVNVNLKGKTALVMGREGEGLHRLVREVCDGLIRIPAGGRLDSLNVATAAGILLYETRRQQGFPHIGL